MDNRDSMDRKDEISPVGKPVLRGANWVGIVLALLPFFLLLLLVFLSKKRVPPAPAGQAKSKRGSRKPLDSGLLDQSLREVVRVQGPLLTPTELFTALREQGLPLRSPQQMGQELSFLGLRSEVRTVPGRRERRWYMLASYQENGETV